nr:alanine:cation symporter family protein [Microbacterium sp. NIBRBAC000506063]
MGVTGGETSPAWIPFVVGGVVATLTALVIFGGIRRIATISQAAIPAVAFAYLIIGIIIVGINAEHLPAAAASIFTDAWGPNQVIGATLGVIIMEGVRRGMFSNEAGLGSVPNAGATAAVTHPSSRDSYRPSASTSTPGWSARSQPSSSSSPHPTSPPRSAACT